MEISLVSGVRRRPRSVAELYVRFFLSRLEHPLFVTEGIGKNHVAAVIDKVKRRIFTLDEFGNIRFHHQLIVLQTHFFRGGFRSVDEILVIGGGFVVQTNKTEFEIFGNGDLGIIGRFNAFIGGKSQFV